MERPEPLVSMNFEEHNRQKQLENEKREQSKFVPLTKNVQIHIASKEQLTSEEMERVAEWAEEVINKKSKTRKHIMHKMMKGENRKDKMFKNVDIDLDGAKNLFK